MKNNVVSSVVTAVITAAVVAGGSQYFSAPIREIEKLEIRVSDLEQLDKLKAVEQGARGEWMRQQTEFTKSLTSSQSGLNEQVVRMVEQISTISATLDDIAVRTRRTEMKLAAQ